uniref:Plexin b2b n=1 Tax=Takifugu rubripes TaxID=31033 RepID=A0A674N0X1_TAKRU
MASWVSLLLLLFCKSVSQAEEENNNIPLQEFTSDTLINNVVQDPQTGRIYLGAVDSIFQLGPSLRLQARTETGPREDARACTPPASACQDTKLMPNVNKLLLVHRSNGSLIVCGSRYRGICSLLNLTNVDQQLYYSDNKGERTYVASIEDNVNVVGVMSNFSKDGKTFSVFLVGKGYGSLDSMKLISTRILQDYRDWVVFESIIETSTVQTIPFVPKFLHDFRLAFKEDGFVYFLFSRTLDGTDSKNLTFVSRLCEEDQHYYSHTELQLSCGKNNRYNKVQAGYVASPGKELVRAMSESGSLGMPESKFLFVVRLVDIISACYSDSGKISGEPAVDMPYFFKTEFCTSNIAVSDTLKNYKCGADFLPSPLASKPQFALKANALLTRPGLLTAVAVAVENDHTVAFLGNDQGVVVKVQLFSCLPVFALQSFCYINMGCILDSPGLLCLIRFHLMMLQITKVPVQTCLQKRDCQSCVAMADPYCGWCVLEGRCTRRSECRRAEEKNAWLWSPRKECVKIVSFYPPNLSRKKSKKVCPPTLTHPPFILILIVLCHSIFLHVSNILHIFMAFVCVGDFSLVCALTCMACVASSWGCQWNTEDHTYVNDRAWAIPFVWMHLQGSKCPKFENPDPVLIPVGYKTRISFEGMNLERYQSQKTNVLFYMKDKESGKKMDSTLNVTLYNCSVGRQDCSLCKNAPMTQRCVWCAKQKACVYEKLCNPEQQGGDDPYNTECPNPQITDIIPRFGPMGGGISITILGSNLGIHSDDIKSISVVGEPYVHVVGDLCNVSHQNPIPEAVTPPRGLKAGGTLITISGQFLDTGSKEDVQVTIGGVACTSFGVEITCRTGGYKGEKVPSDPFAVMVKYGKSTTTEISSAFQFVENPIVLDHNPKKSFVWSPSQMKTTAKCCLYLSYIFNTAHVIWTNTQTRCFENYGLSSQGRGFSKAMTAKEAQAFVGDVPCQVNTLQDDKLFLDPPSTPPRARSRRQRRDTRPELLDLMIKFGKGEWVVGSVQYEKKNDLSLYIIIPAVVVPMLLIIVISIYCYRRKSQQAEREYEKVKHQLENLEESVRDRCKKEFTDLMIEMEDHTNDLSEGRIPFLDYKTYTDRVFFLTSKDGANDVMITGRLEIPQARRATVMQALNQFSNLLNSKTFLINFIRTLERSNDFNARAKVYFASLLTVALHGKLEYYTDIMRTLLLELMEEYVHSKNPKLMLRRSETVVERMLCNWMSICLYQFLKDSAGEPLYKLFRAIKHQIEKGPVDARVKKAKYTLNDTGLLGDDVEYSVLTLQVLVQDEGPDVTSVKVLNCDTISQVKEKIIEQVYRNLPYSQRPKVDSVTLEWRPGSTGQILSDLDLTSQKEGRWKRINTLAHYNVRDNATLVLSRALQTQQNYDQNQENHEERNALLEDDKVFHLVRPADELDEIKSKRGSIKDKSMTKAITEIYLTRLLSVKGTLQQFVDDFFRSVLCTGAVVPPAVKYFFDFLDEQALKHSVDDETIHIWKTNSLPLRFWVNILKNPNFIFDIHVSEVVDASLSVIAQTFMDACTKSEHKLSRDSPSNKLLYAKEISTYKKMVDDYYKGIRQMVPVSDQDMNTHLAEVSRSHTDKLKTQVALHQLYQYASKYYDGIIASLDEDPAAQSKQLTLRLQQIAAALENKVTDL